MKISFVTTVLNEEKSIDAFIKSIFLQTKTPDEIIIVDGGSTDATASVISNLKSQISNKQIKFKFIRKKGNRAVGRNDGVKNATGDIILISDAGCILDKNWVQNITEHFIDPKVDVVAGYYRGNAKNVFEKCLVPYVLVMPDKVNKDTFLPASRSMAFRKTVWEKVGGFPEQFSNNEDYVFGNNLKKINAKIIFKKDAIVNWIPRKNIKDAFKMFFRFALGDSESGIYRPKVLLVFARYLILPYLFFLAFIYKSIVLSFLIILFLIAYIVWSIFKNYKYIKNKQAFIYLPLIQFTSDFAVLLGTFTGLIKCVNKKSLFNLIVKYKFVSIIIGIYVFTMLSVINWGIPNPNHPFPYHMDEWHQLQSIRAIFEHGSPNVSGAANGTMFQFILSGIYLSPFVFLKIIDPFSIKSEIDSLLMHQKLFEILRLNTLIFGILSLLTLSTLVKKYFEINSILTLIFFTVTPLWLALSNYFKYDIALTFWIITSLFFLLKYGSKPTFKNYIIAGVFCSLAVATKISAIPLFLIYLLSFFYFNLSRKKEYKHLLFGLLIFIFIFLSMGIPDLILQRGDYREYLYSNLVRDPMIFDNFVLKYNPWWIYLIKKIIPLNFGYIFSGITVLALIYLATKLNVRKFKNETFIFISMIIFIISLIPLELGANGNRLLVLLPFFAILSSLFIQRIINNFPLLKYRLYALLAFLFILQFYQSFAMISIKWQKDIRELSSIWLVENVKKGSTIGIQNIPIYQLLPDLIVKEFYLKKDNSAFKYQIVDESSRLPNIVVITNKEFGLNHLKKSPKKSLLARLNKEGYKKIKEFKPPEILYRTMGNEFDFYSSGLVPIWTISIYKQDKNPQN